MPQSLRQSSTKSPPRYNAFFDLLREGNTITVNRVLAQKIGLNEAIVYSSLLAKDHYYSVRPGYDGWFFSTEEDLQESTTLKRRAQTSAIKNLKGEGLISLSVRGMPARRYFKINRDIDVLIRILNREDKEEDQGGEIGCGAPVCTKRTNKNVHSVQTSMDEPYKQECTNGTSKPMVETKGKTSVNQSETDGRIDAFGLSAEDALKTQSDHDAIFREAKRCGLPVTDKGIADALELYAVHGLDKLLEAINKAGEQPKDKWHWRYVAGILKEKPPVDDGKW